MKRVRCEHCNRETYTSATADFPKRDRSGNACTRREFFNGKRECNTFTAGRRAAFKDAIKIVRSHNRTAGNVNEADVLRAIRKAMKPARVK